MLVQLFDSTRTSFCNYRTIHFISCIAVAHCSVFYLPLRSFCTHIFNPLLLQGLFQGGCLCSTFPPPAHIRARRPPLTPRVLCAPVLQHLLYSVSTLFSTPPSSLVTVLILRVCEQFSVTSFPSVILLPYPFCSGR